MMGPCLHYDCTSNLFGYCNSTACINPNYNFRSLTTMQTEDLVEVVRCKDCKWYKESKNPEIYPMRFCYRLKNDNGDPVGYNWDGNDFCSHGERRDKMTASYYGDNKLFETIVVDERKDDDKH